MTRRWYDNRQRRLEACLLEEREKMKLIFLKLSAHVPEVEIDYCKTEYVSVSGEVKKNYIVKF